MLRYVALRLGIALLQLIGLATVMAVPSLATWLPELLFK